MNRAGVQRVIPRIRDISERARGNFGLDLRVCQIRPVALDANERCSGQSGERTVRVLPAGIDSLANLGLGRIVSLGGSISAKPMRIRPLPASSIAKSDGSTSDKSHNT